jgi:alkylated DNA repair protein (DNA oxidative demethylase)
MRTASSGEADFCWNYPGQLLMESGAGLWCGEVTRIKGREARRIERRQVDRPRCCAEDRLSDSGGQRLTDMPDLFGAPVLPGLTKTSDFVTETEEQTLIAAIDAAELAPFRFQGWTGKRLTASYGWSYDFDAGCLLRGDRLPDWLLPFRARAAGFAGLSPDDLVQALLIRYDPGAGIGWHKDRPNFEHVVGLSLGAPATMRFRRRRGDRFERATTPLAPRAAYHLSGEARQDWEHSIAELGQTRWSVTFRSMRDRGA